MRHSGHLSERSLNKHPNRTDFKDFTHGTVLMDVMGSQYIASVEVGITPDDEFVFYDVVDIIPTSFALKNEPDAPSIVTTNESPDDKPGARFVTSKTVRGCHTIYAIIKFNDCNR